MCSDYSLKIKVWNLIKLTVFGNWQVAREQIIAKQRNSQHSYGGAGRGQKQCGSWSPIVPVTAFVMSAFFVIYSLLITYTWGVKIFPKYRSHLKILCARTVT
jgi:hypothetical protein